MNRRCAMLRSDGLQSRRVRSGNDGQSILRDVVDGVRQQGGKVVVAHFVGALEQVVEDGVDRLGDDHCLAVPALAAGHKSIQPRHDDEDPACEVVVLCLDQPVSDVQRGKARP